jgi:hypothetical protein
LDIRSPRLHLAELSSSLPIGCLSYEITGDFLTPQQLEEKTHEGLCPFMRQYIHKSLIYSDLTDVKSENPAGIGHVFPCVPPPSHNTQNCFHASCGGMTHDSDGT